MKKIHILTVALAMLAVLLTAPAAMAVADFVVNAAPSGANWIYSIQNNTAVSGSKYVVDWYLYYADPIEGATNTAAAAANFDIPTGYIVYNPPVWDKDNSFGGPGFVVTGNYNTGVAPMTTSPNFTVHYKTGTLPTKALLVWQSATSADYFYTTVPTTPEPSSILTLILGCVGSIGFIRFRKR